MLSFLSRLFSSKSNNLNIGGPITAHSIYSYAMNLEKDRERLHDVTWNRGLAFGDLHLDNVFGKTLEFYLYHEDSRDISLERVQAILESLISKRKLTWLSVHKDEEWHKLIVEVDMTASNSIECAWWSGVKGPNFTPYQQRVFMTVVKHSAIKFSVNGVEGLAMILHVAKELGFRTTPARYAKESSIPISEIVVYAYHWEDVSTGKYYTEVKYKTKEEKSSSWVGANQVEIFTQDDYKIVVLGGIEKPAKFKLNNLMVKSRVVKEPTCRMLETQQRIRDFQKKHYVCSIKECGRKAAYEINTTHFEMTGFGGTSSMGGISYSCNDLEHKKTIEGQSEGIRVTSYPIHELQSW
jgi:hypothetical protein